MALFDDSEDENGEAHDSAAEDGLTAAGHSGGLLLPRQNFLSLGHDAVEQSLIKRFNADKFPHALIFSGPEGIGKATFAFRLARFLLSRPPEGSIFSTDEAPVDNFTVAEDHPAVRRVNSGGHADIMVIGRIFDEKKGKFSNDIPVDEVRKVTPFLRKTASEGGWRVVIVDHAQHLNRSSQNALLKILEEPPKKTVLVLITDQAGRFLPTIRSRCQTYDFHVLSDDYMKQLIKTADLNLHGSDLQTVLNLSDGSIGRALGLIEQGGLDIYNEVLDFLERCPDTGQLYAIERSEDIGRDNKRFPVFMDILRAIVSKMALAVAQNGLPAAATDRERGIMERLGKAYTGPQWLDIYDKLNRILSDTDRIHLDMKQAVLEVIWAFKKD